MQAKWKEFIISTTPGHDVMIDSQRATEQDVANNWVASAVSVHVTANGKWLHSDVIPVYNKLLHLLLPVLEA